MSSELPEGWQDVSLSDCLEDFRNGWTYDTRALDGTMPITRIETISNGEIDYDRIGFAQPDGRIEAFRLRPNDILFSHINSVEHIAKVAIKHDDRPLYHGMNLMRLRPNGQVVPHFLFARLQSEKARDHFRSVCKRAVNQASLNKGEIGSYRLSLPPVEEQRRIAEVLRSVDEAIAAQQRAALQMQSLLQATCCDLLPDPNAVLDYDGWSQVTIGEFAKIRTGKTPSTKNGDYWDGDIPFVTPTDLGNDLSVPTTARTLTGEGARQSTVTPPNSVLYTCIASIGKIGLAEKAVAFNQQINACACRDFNDAAFLYWSLYRMTPIIRDLCGTTAVPIINKGAFSRLNLWVPEASARGEIGMTLNQLASVVQNAHQTVAQTRTLKNRIMSDLLSGRVRVPE